MYKIKGEKKVSFKEMSFEIENYLEYYFVDPQRKGLGKGRQERGVTRTLGNQGWERGETSHPHGDKL